MQKDLLAKREADEKELKVRFKAKRLPASVT